MNENVFFSKWSVSNRFNETTMLLTFENVLLNYFFRHAIRHTSSKHKRRLFKMRPVLICTKEVTFFQPSDLFFHEKSFFLN